MSKAAGLDYYLGAAHRNSLCQDPGASCCKPFLPSPLQSDFHWGSPTDSCAIPMGRDMSGGSQEATHNSGGAGGPPWVHFSPWVNRRHRRDLSAWFCSMLGVGACTQHVTYYPFNVICLGLCDTGSVLGFSQWCLVHEYLLVDLVENQSQEECPISPPC